MKQKIRLVFNLIFVCFLVLFTSCEAEKDFAKESDSGRQMRREITFEQFKREIGHPNFSTRMSIVLGTAKTLEDFDIDSTQVRALETNYLVYSMKLDPKFIAEDGKFYNLFVYRDNDNEIVKQIMEILPTITITGDTEQELHTFLQTATKELIYSSKMMGTSAICITTELVELCYCYGHRWYECNGCSMGFHWANIFTCGACPSTGGGGGGLGGGGVAVDPVLPTRNKDNCYDLQTKSNNQEFKDKMNELKADANGTTGEKAFQTFSGTPKFSEKYSATAEDPSGIQMPVPYPARTDCTGFMHCHMNDPALKNFAIFSPNDFIAQRDLIQNSTAPVTSFTMYVTSQIQGVSNTFAIKITDIERFNVMAGLMEAFPNVYKKIWTNKIKETNTPDIQINVFLKEMQKAGFEGFELYKSDENLENWEQQTLNNSVNTIKIKC
jgi:hypothetical protein